jgi:hypothetical protein
VDRSARVAALDPCDGPRLGGLTCLFGRRLAGQHRGRNQGDGEEEWQQADELDRRLAFLAGGAERHVCGSKRPSAPM